jgi:hypothetical protein
MIYADPVAAAEAITQAAAVVHPVSAWKIIRRELIIGLAWGVALAFLVAYPLVVQPAYRLPDGKIQSYPPPQRDENGVRIYQPGTSPLEWGEWLTLTGETCGSVIAIAVGIGLLVGTGKVIWRRCFRTVLGA